MNVLCALDYCVLSALAISLFYAFFVIFQLWGHLRTENGYCGSVAIHHHLPHLKEEDQGLYIGILESLYSLPQKEAHRYFSLWQLLSLHLSLAKEIFLLPVTLLSHLLFSNNTGESLPLVFSLQEGKEGKIIQQELLVSPQFLSLFAKTRLLPFYGLAVLEGNALQWEKLKINEHNQNAVRSAISLLFLHNTLMSVYTSSEKTPPPLVIDYTGRRLLPSSLMPLFLYYLSRAHSSFFPFSLVLSFLVLLKRLWKRQFSLFPSMDAVLLPTYVESIKSLFHISLSYLLLHISFSFLSSFLGDTLLLPRFALCLLLEGMISPFLSHSLSSLLSPRIVPLKVDVSNKMHLNAFSSNKKMVKEESLSSISNMKKLQSIHKVNVLLLLLFTFLLFSLSLLSLFSLFSLTPNQFLLLFSLLSFSYVSRCILFPCLLSLLSLQVLQTKSTRSWKCLILLLESFSLAQKRPHYHYTPPKPVESSVITENEKSSSPLFSPNERPLKHSTKRYYTPQNNSLLHSPTRRITLTAPFSPPASQEASRPKAEALSTLLQAPESARTKLLLDRKFDEDIFFTPMREREGSERLRGFLKRKITWKKKPFTLWGQQENEREKERKRRKWKVFQMPNCEGLYHSAVTNFPSFDLQILSFWFVIISMRVKEGLDLGERIEEKVIERPDHSQEVLEKIEAEVKESNSLLEEGTFGYLEKDPFSGNKIFKDYLLECVNADILNSQKGIVTEMIGRLAKSLATGTSPILSLPVRMFEARTAFHRIATALSYLPLYLHVASQLPISREYDKERFQLCFTALFAGLHLSGSQLKPFSPTLGETLNTKWINGTYFHCEQTSSHPPISNFFIQHDEFHVWGYIETVPKVDAYGNELLIQQFGDVTAWFIKAQQRVSIQPVHIRIFGMLYGKRRACPEGSFYGYDSSGITLYGTLDISKKLFTAELQYNPSLEKKLVEQNIQSGQKNAKKHLQFLKSIPFSPYADYSNLYKSYLQPSSEHHHHHKKVTLSRVEGNWLQYLQYDQSVWWKSSLIEKENVPKPIPLWSSYILTNGEEKLTLPKMQEYEGNRSDFVLSERSIHLMLPSDSLLRKDLFLWDYCLMLRARNGENRQKWEAEAQLRKEEVEAIQRQHRKWRNAARTSCHVPISKYQ